MCEDVPKLAAGLSDLTRELVAATVDAAFYAYQLRWVVVWCGGGGIQLGVGAVRAGVGWGCSSLGSGMLDPWCCACTALYLPSPLHVLCCRQYSGTHRYTAAILAYVFGVGSFMAVVSPNFGGLFKRQQALEGTHRALQVGAEGGFGLWARVGGGGVLPAATTRAPALPACRCPLTVCCPITR